MKAAVVNKFKEALEIKDLPKPSPKSGEILVKIHASGVCHTDLHAAHGDWPVKPKLPLVPGHEGVGIVEEVGENVTHIKVGDRVGIPWLYSACGYCDHCLEGKETLCKDQKNAGYSIDGAFAEYCVAVANYTVKIPDNLEFIDAAPLFCAGVTTYKALKVSAAKPGQWVSVVGIGGLGHLAVQYAKAMGLNVIAVDIDDKKLELAKSLGADLTVNSKEVDSSEFIQEKVGGVQASIVVAVNKIAFAQAYKSLKRSGKLVAVGLPTGSIEVPIFDTVLNAIEVVGSIVGTRRDLKEALQFASEGKVKCTVETRKLEDINEVLADMEKGQINGRVVLDMNA